MVILAKFSSSAALEVVDSTMSSAANDENFIQMTNIFVSVYIGCDPNVITAPADN